MQSKNILIIDDHTLFRTGMKLILMQVGKAESVAEANSIKNSFELSEQKFDVILLDIHMPGVNGIDGIKPLKEKFSNTPIIILSASTEMQDIAKAKSLGAAGFINKASAADEMVSSISLVIDGGSCFCEEELDEAAIDNIGDGLTARQLEVLIHLCEGKPNKLIARKLDMSENTVRVHVSAILNTLGASNRTEAILIAQREGITS